MEKDMTGACIYCGQIAIMDQEEINEVQMNVDLIKRLVVGG